MHTQIVLSIEVFIFIMCVLNIIKNAYSFIKVFSKQEGKFESTDLSVILFGLSFSYVLTSLIIGF